jgi:hypothetical protein
MSAASEPGTNAPAGAASLAPERTRWLFSAPVDLAAFGGSALVAIAALFVGAHLGLLHGDRHDTPDWAWVPFVLLIDVAHVWATTFRVYFVPEELRRRPLLYAMVPVAAFIIGAAIYSDRHLGPLLFWRVLAYLAVFHFVRQQYGWVALYRARLGERDRIGKWIDTSAIYLATVYPLVWWHAHLPRQFWWFVENDWRLPADSSIADTVARAEQILQPIYWLALLLYAGHSLWAWCSGRANPGKDLVVATTAVCWYVGIVWFNSDYAFTVTNVIIHGVPYFVLVWWYWQRTAPGETSYPPARFHGKTLASRRLRSILVFIATVWLLAYVEELFWHRGIRDGERTWLFGQPWDIGPWKMLLAPLLAVPQITHYVLDGFIWRRRTNPQVADLVGGDCSSNA